LALAGSVADESQVDVCTFVATTGERLQALESSPLYLVRRRDVKALQIVQWEWHLQPVEHRVAIGVDDAETMGVGVVVWKDGGSSPGAAPLPSGRRGVLELIDLARSSFGGCRRYGRVFGTGAESESSDRPSCWRDR
jgi:hypothetical protein